MRKVIDIDAEISHHVKMAAYHTKEATQLLEKKGSVSTEPKTKKRKGLTREQRDQLIAKVLHH